MVYGGPDVGKTTGWLQIAETLRKGGGTKETVRFWVIDTDYTVDRSLEEYPELLDSGIVASTTCPDWATVVRTLQRYKAQVGSRPDDWIVVDMINPVWDYVQEDFIERTSGKDSEDFFLAHRLSLKAGGALDGFKDWSVINKFYQGKFAVPLKQMPCHTYVVASGKAVSRDLDSKLLVDMYGVVGIRPTGQKDTSHQNHSVVLLRKRVGMRADAPAWTLTTLKERAGRKRLEQADAGNFAISYLVRVAGWRP
jgi:hypothetical protein